MHGAHPHKSTQVGPARVKKMEREREREVKHLLNMVG